MIRPLRSRFSVLGRPSVAAFSGLALSLVWLSCASPGPAPKVDRDWLRLERGSDSGHGNLVGLQPFMTPYDYASRARFEAKLRSAFAAAAAEAWFGPKTVVVLPEYLGAWLVLLDEGADAFDAPTVGEGITSLVLAHLPSFLWARSFAPAEDSDRYAVFSIKAEKMARAYQYVFSLLAKKHGVTIVAGSILLPSPEIEDGRIVVHPGQPIYNTSFVFGPDGALLGPPVKKVFPTADEQGFVAAAPAEELPVFKTPAGRLGVLVCADAWYPEAYRALDAKSVELIAVPVFGSGDDFWLSKWKGYSGYPEPADVDRADIGKLTEAEAWINYALTARMAKTEARAGLLVPLRGALWDLGDDGFGMLVDRQGFDAAARVDGPALLNLWLDEPSTEPSAELVAQPGAN